MQTEHQPPLPTWRASDGAPVSCVEKLKVLNDNYRELRQVAQDAFDDALLIGCDGTQIRQALHELVESLRDCYGQSTK